MPTLNNVHFVYPSEIRQNLGATKKVCQPAMSHDHPRALNNSLVNINKMIDRSDEINKCCNRKAKLMKVLHYMSFDRLNLTHHTKSDHHTKSI